jgi:hypothetical protein
MKWILGFLFWWWQVLGMNKIVATSQSSNNSYELPFGHSLLLNKVSLKNVDHFWTWHSLSLFFNRFLSRPWLKLGMNNIVPTYQGSSDSCGLLWTLSQALSRSLSQGLPLKVFLSRCLTPGLSLKVFWHHNGKDHGDPFDFEKTIAKIMGIPLILKAQCSRSWGSLWFWNQNAQDHGESLWFWQ